MRRESHSTIHRPYRAAREPRRARGARHQPAMVLAPRDPRRVRGDRPGPVGRGRPRSGPAAGRGVGRAASPSCPPTRASSTGPNRSRDDLRGYLASDRWFQSLGAEAPAGIAYFSPEYGIAAALPQYSGGLGILAGDHLKTASDLGVPIIAIGLFYRSGYFKQSLSRDGWQQERYPVTDPDGSPVSLLREPDGTPAKVAVGLPGGRFIAARIWVAQVGRVPLLLLDSDVEENNAVRARGHRPALRRRQRASPAAGDAARHRRRARAARLLPHHRRIRPLRCSTRTRAMPASSASSASASSSPRTRR